MPEKGKRFHDFGVFSLNETERVLLKSGVAVPLGVKAFDTLLALIQRRGEVVERDALIRLVWGDWKVSANNLDQQIGKVREALGRNSHNRGYIETIPGVGYRFTEDVTERVEVGAAPFGDSRPAVAGQKRRARMTILLCVVLPSAALLVLSFLVGHGHPGVVRYVVLTNDGKEKQGPLLSDGRRLIFEERFGDRMKAVSIPLTGGEPVPLSIPVPYIDLLDVSPDNGSLLIAARHKDTHQIWSYPLWGGAPLLLAGRNGEGVFQGLSPDEETAAFSGDDKLILAGPGAKRAIAVRLPGDVYGHARWAPDGSSIRFAAPDRKSGILSIWEMRSDGRDPHRLSLLSSGSDNAYAGTWSRDGRYFVYQAGSSSHQELWVARGRAHLPVRLTNGALSWRWPAFAAENNTLFAIGQHERSELDRYDRRAKVWRPLWNGISAYELDYSRDRAWVVYVRFPDHTLWKSKADGTERVQLMRPTVLVHQPHWSPDGTRIAFMGQKKSGEWRVFLFPADGGPLEEALPRGEDQGVPTWSPDGNSIVFGDLLYRKPGPQMSIHVLDLRTHQASELPGSKGLWTPRWSPDGKYISALTYNFKTLSVLDRKTDRWRELLRMNFIDNTVWSPDSRFIYFNAVSDQQENAWFRVGVPGGKIERIVSLADAPAPNENWYGVMPNGTLLALRDIKFQEVYALECILP